MTEENIPVSRPLPQTTSGNYCQLVQTRMRGMDRRTPAGRCHHFRCFAATLWVRLANGETDRHSYPKTPTDFARSPGTSVIEHAAGDQPEQVKAEEAEALMPECRVQSQEKSASPRGSSGTPLPASRKDGQRLRKLSSARILTLKKTSRASHWHKTEFCTTNDKNS